MIVSTKYPYNGEPGEITLKVDPREMSAVVLGQAWFGVEEGKPIFWPKYKALPPAIDDDQILPFWNGGISRKIFEYSQDAPWSPHFDIQHLCGYNYTKELYEIEARKLESYGFDCLRSKRGLDGRYTEIWHLSGYWAAKGELKDFVKNNIEIIKDSTHTPEGHLKTNEIKIKLIINWLREHISFGSLDVSYQRAAMVVD